MAKIVVGEGPALALLEVPKVPKVGDRITIRREQILRAATSGAELLIGDTFVLISETKAQIKNDLLPWFGIQNVKSD